MQATGQYFPQCVVAPSMAMYHDSLSWRRWSIARARIRFWPMIERMEKRWNEVVMIIYCASEWRTNRVYLANFTENDRHAELWDASDSLDWICPPPNSKNEAEIQIKAIACGPKRLSSSEWPEEKNHLRTSFRDIGRVGKLDSVKPDGSIASQFVSAQVNSWS